MKALVQRVLKAKVTVAKKKVAEIDRGLLVFLGIESKDTQEEVLYLVKKLAHLRIFEDASGKFQESVLTIKGQVLVVSQFTLVANYKKGHRPDFLDAAKKEVALPLYELFIKKMSEYVPTNYGIFGASMDIELINQGPATFYLESR